MATAEAILSSAASMAVSFHEDTTPEVLKSKAKETINLIACVTQTGEAGDLLVMRSFHLVLCLLYGSLLACSGLHVMASPRCGRWTDCQVPPSLPDRGGLH